MTPSEAMKPSNKHDVKMNLELRARHTRIYPNINVGDYVKIYKKKDKLDKERVSNWTNESYRVEAIHESMGQPFYKLEGQVKDLMRSEILLVS
jgi:hypothetical protein